MMDFEGLFTVASLISFLTLTLLEIVLGIDNIIFISIISGRLPESQQPKARTIGLALALLMRVVLLFGISYIIGFTRPLFSVMEVDFSGRDLILFLGGLFLIAKSTTEIHGKVAGEEEEELKKSKKQSLQFIILQIVLLDVVFSFDSILTAIGLVENILIMIGAVVVAMVIMLIFAEKVSDFVHDHPTIKMLALSFLLMIGFLLVLDAFHVHVPKGYVYFAMAFSLLVELLNIRARKIRSDNREVEKAKSSK